MCSLLALLFARVRARLFFEPLARGVGADDGNRTRVICLEGRRSTIELHPHVAPHRFACGFCLPGRAGLGAYLSVLFMSVRGARCFRQPHAVVISGRARVGANCEGEAGAVCAGSVVAAQDCEGELRVVAFYHDEDCVYLVAVRVVVVLAVFDVGVHDAGGVVAALVRVFEVVPAVHASHAAFVAFDGERVAVVEGEGGGSYFVVADGNVGDVSASENLCVFFCRAVLVEDCRVGGWGARGVSSCPSSSRRAYNRRRGSRHSRSTRSPSLRDSSRTLSRS